MQSSVSTRIVVALITLFGMLQSACAGYQESRQAFLLGDYQTAYRECITSANAGNLDCQNAIGVLQYRGLGTAKNPAQAIRWFHKAAMKGHANAHYHLGLMYQAGEATIQNFDEAFKHFSKAADAGHIKAQTNVGNLLATGKTGRKDSQGALYWWQLAAESGDPMAQNNLGWAYFNGFGVAVNVAQARTWLQKAINQEADANAKELAQQNLRSMGELPFDVTSGSELPIDIKLGVVDEDGKLIIEVRLPDGVNLKQLHVAGRSVEAAGRRQITVSRYVPVGSSTIEIFAESVSGKRFRNQYEIQRKTPMQLALLPELDPSKIAAQPRNDAVAIVIGAEAYESMPHADFADNDARAFFDYANKALGVKSEKIKLLAGSGARRSEMLQVLRHWLAAEVTPGQTDVYIYYSGHGLSSTDGKKRYLLPVDAKLDLLDDTALSQEQLIEIVAGHQARSLTMMLDSCFSGLHRSGGTLLASQRPIVIQSDFQKLPSNVTLISSSSGSQVSVASGELRHGLFSYFLMKGLEGDADGDHNGQITAHELHEYLGARVSKEATRRGIQQMPAFYGNRNQILVVGKK